MPNKKNFVFNGQLRDEYTVEFEWPNRGIKYGDGLFETIRLIEGKIPFWDQHISRLKSGLTFLGLDAYQFDSNKNLDLCLELLEKEGIHLNGTIRIQIWRGGSGKYLPSEYDFNSLIEVNGFDGKGFWDRTKSTVCIYPVPLVSKTPLSSFKTSNALPYITAAIYARKNGCDDCLISSSESFSEFTSSNLFIQTKEILYTPGLNSGCLPGVMRNVVIRIAGKTGLKVKQENLTKEIFESAESILMTNSIMGLREVEKISGVDKRFGNEVFVRNLHQAILKEYL